MNRTKLLTLILAGLLVAGTLTACKNSDEDADESTTETETTEVTAIPRYDYLEAEVAKDVIIDKSAYTDVTLTIPTSLKITDESVADFIKGLCFKAREAVNGSTQVKDQAISLGDDAFIYYKGFLDGKEFDGGSNWDDKEPAQLGIGSNTFIPGFEDGLVGVIPNETSKDKPFDLHVTFPEDYGEKSLAGKAVVFQVAVMHIVQYTVPEYNWEFVEKVQKYELEEDFYASDRAKLDEFEEFVRETLVSKNQTNVDNAMVDALWTHLIEKATCKNLPELEMKYYTDGYTSDLQSQYEYYSSYGGEEFKKLYPTIDAFAVVAMGLDKDTDWKAEIQKRATQMVEKDMIGHAIGETEGIESVTDEEYKEQVKYWVTYYSGYMTEAEIVKSMGELFLRRQAYDAKILDWLMDRITFTYEDGTALDSTTSAPAESETTADSTTETTVDSTTETTAETTADSTTETSAESTVESVATSETVTETESAAEEATETEA